MTDTVVTIEQQVQTVEVDQQSVIVSNPQVQVVTASVPGPAGAGVPVGGAMHEALRKASSANFDTEWFSESEIDNGSSGVSETIDFADGRFHKSTLTANASYTFEDPASAIEVQVKVVQDSTPRTITWPLSAKWPGNIAPTLSQGSGDVDIFRFYFDGTNYWSIGLHRDLA